MEKRLKGLGRVWVSPKAMYLLVCDCTWLEVNRLMPSFLCVRILLFPIREGKLGFHNFAKPKRQHLMFVWFLSFLCYFVWRLVLTDHVLELYQTRKLLARGFFFRTFAQIAKLLTEFFSAH